MNEDLKVRLYNDIPTNDWRTQIFNGDFYIHNKLYHFYADPGKEYIPSGVNPYTLTGTSNLLDGYPITIADIDGTTSPSGTFFQHVTEFTGTGPYQFTYSGGQIEFNNPQNGLYLYYETSPSGWFTVSGWDFNPTHTILEDGFIWVSNREQAINLSGYMLNVYPSILTAGGGSSVLQGSLLDVEGEGVAGALAHFRLIPSNLGSLAASEGVTGIDGNAYNLYSSPTGRTSFSKHAESFAGNNIVVSGFINPLIDIPDIWTTYEVADVSGYPDPMNVVLMEKKDTVNVTINPSDWRTPNPLDANALSYRGIYTVGGTSSQGILGTSNLGDDLFNIDLSSLEVNAGTWNMVPSVDISGASSPVFYDIDNYGSPQDYGKLEIYTAIIPSGNVDIRFDVYEPAHPIAILPDVPASGLTTLTYDFPIPSGDYTVYTPNVVTVESWATWQGEDTNHVFENISMIFPTNWTGVFRADVKFLNRLSYLRVT